MPVYNFTIDDISPAIVYNGAWNDSSHSDAAWSSYFDGTFHATQQLDASASLTFSGSAVYMFGAFRINHNFYWVALDGQVAAEDGQSNDPHYQQNMFSAERLNSGQHNITLQNKFTSPAAPFVDLDYIVVTTGDGNPQTQSVDRTLDDSDPSITYSPSWNVTSEIDYYNSTSHCTSISGSFASIAFHGNAISVYGGTAPDHGLFNVSLDGGPALTLNGSAPVVRNQVLLYYASELSNAPHNLTFTNVDNMGTSFDLDKIIISDWSASTENTPSVVLGKPTSSSSGTASDHHTEVAPIVAGTVSGVVVLALIIGMVVFLLRHCQRRRPPPFTVSPFEPHHPRLSRPRSRRPYIPGENHVTAVRSSIDPGSSAPSSAGRPVLDRRSSQSNDISTMQKLSIGGGAAQHGGTRLRALHLVPSHDATLSEAPPPSYRG